MMVTIEEWQNDIELTRKECEAYWQISQGFEVLESLPENVSSGKSAFYKARAFHYLSLWNQCDDFLKKLIAYDGPFDGLEADEAQPYGPQYGRPEKTL